MDKKVKRRLKIFFSFPIWILLKICYFCVGPIIFSNVNGRNSEVNTAADVICYEYTERKSWLALMCGIFPCCNSLMRGQQSIRNKLDWNMAHFFLSVVLALIPMSWSLIQSQSTKYPLCTRATDCLTVPAKNMCNSMYSCASSDFKVACSERGVKLQFASERCELTNLSNPVGLGPNLLSAAVSSPPYSECWSFWIELILYFIFLFSCAIFWLFERDEKFCFAVAFPNGFVLDPTSYQRSFSSISNDSSHRRWSMVKGERDLIHCAVAR